MVFTAKESIFWLADMRKVLCKIWKGDLGTKRYGTAGVWAESRLIPECAQWLACLARLII